MNTSGNHGCQKVACGSFEKLQHVKALMHVLKYNLFDVTCLFNEHKRLYIEGQVYFDFKRFFDVTSHSNFQGSWDLDIF